MTDDLEELLGHAHRTATIVRAVTIGLGHFDPVYPYHGAYSQCPFCDEIYKVHGVFADHRDRCEDGPNPVA